MNTTHGPMSVKHLFQLRDFLLHSKDRCPQELRAPKLLETTTVGDPSRNGHETELATRQVRCSKVSDLPSVPGIATQHVPLCHSANKPSACHTALLSSHHPSKTALAQNVVRNVLVKSLALGHVDV